MSDEGTIKVPTWALPIGVSSDSQVPLVWGASASPEHKQHKKKLTALKQSSKRR